MNDLPSLLLSLLGRPHMIVSGNAEIIVRALLDRASGKTQAPEPRRKAAAMDGLTLSEMENAPLRIVNGVAVVPVCGTLVHRTMGMEALCGLSSYQTIRADIERALADSKVNAVLLDFDSPGGDVAGVFQLHDWLIAQRSGSKPIWAIANEWCCSAAYLLASAAQRIIAPQNALIGSIGVVACHVDVSQQDKLLGEVWTAVYAGSHKMDYWSHAPMSNEARARLQADIEATYVQFVSAVASARSLDANAVRNTEALTYRASDAFSRGLIDVVGNFDDAVNALAARAAAARSSVSVLSSGTAAAVSNPATQEVSMADPKTAAPADPGAIPAVAAAPASPPTSVADPVPAPAAVAPAQAAADPKARIKAILGHAEAEGRQQLANYLAFDTDMLVEDALKALAAAPKAVTAAAPSPLAAAMSTLPNPQVAPGGSSAAAADPAQALLATARQHGLCK